jgi:hypothetical protein
VAANPQPLREDKSGKIPDQRIPRLQLSNRIITQ